MFRHHQERKAYEGYQAKLAAWQEQRDAYANLVTLAQTYAGEPSSDIMLKPGEAVLSPPVTPPMPVAHAISV